MRSGAEEDSARSDVEARILEARAARYAEAGESAEAVLTTVVTFVRGESQYALPLTSLREIRRLSGFCPIALAPPTVPGIVHFRGELLSVHDLAAFTRPDTRGQPPTWLLVTEHADSRMGLAADDVLDVIDVPQGAVLPVPLTLGETAEVFTGMTREGILIVDGIKVFEVARFARAF